jgi:hypothetical protein
MKVPRQGTRPHIDRGFAQQIQGRIEYAKADVDSRGILCFPVARSGWPRYLTRENQICVLLGASFRSLVMQMLC